MNFAVGIPRGFLPSVMKLIKLMSRDLSTTGDDVSLLSSPSEVFEVNVVDSIVFVGLNCYQPEVVDWLSFLYDPGSGDIGYFTG